MTETPEQQAQNAKFGYKAPESVYKKHENNMAGSGKSISSCLQVPPFGVVGQLKPSTGENN
jgi:hypothetical protein